MENEQQSWRRKMHLVRNRNAGNGEDAGDAVGDEVGGDADMGDDNTRDLIKEINKDYMTSERCEEERPRSTDRNRYTREKILELPTADALRNAQQAPKRSMDPPESINVANGKLIAKTPAGDVEVTLSEEQTEIFVKKALDYQQAIIREKRANMVGTYAVALLSGLSAVAVGVSLIRSCFTKTNTQIL